MSNLAGTAPRPQLRSPTAEMHCLAKEDTVTYAVIDSDSNQVIGYGCIRPDSSKLHIDFKFTN